MRSFLLALVVAVTAGLMGIGNAAELAACRSVVGPVLPPGDVFDSFQKDCIDAPFAIDADDTPATLSVRAHDVFTGTITASIHTIGIDREYFEVSASYLAGQLADGEESIALSLPKGTYKFQVHASGFGVFSGRIDSVDAPPPSPSDSPSDSPTPEEPPA